MPGRRKLMDKFIRENRYIVIKLKRLTARQSAMVQKILPSIPLACVTAAVVEKDWPEYEPTWRAIEARVTGQPAFDEAAERAAFEAQAPYRTDRYNGVYESQRTQDGWQAWLACARLKAGVTGHE
jgi:hypothetical protein